MPEHREQPLSARTRRPGRAAVALLATLHLACGDDSSGTSHETHADTAATDASTSSSSTSASSEGSSSGSTASTSDASTTHDHGSTSATTGDGTGTETGGADAASYCDCMLNNCHEQYHGTWGEDHVAAEMMCIAAAEALDPAAFACRVERCEAAADDPEACTDAIGGGACM